MNERINLFFDLATSGHHVEFLYHLMTYRLAQPEQGQFILVTHPDFLNCVRQLDSSLASNAPGLTVVHPTHAIIQRLEHMSSGLRRSREEIAVFCDFIEQYNPQKACVMSLNRYQYALGCRRCCRLNCNIHAILFNPLGPIPGKRLGIFTNLRKRMQVRWMLRNRNLKRICILNDESRAALLNESFGEQSLFASIPDPVLILPSGPPCANKTNNTAPSGRHRFLLFGSLSSRKGLFLVLDALRMLPDSLVSRVELVLAGKVVQQQQSAFNEALTSVRKSRPSMLITYRDDFIPYNQIPVLFLSARAILVPYVGNESSSGVLGHAALYSKPVIGPDKGLIGKLINQYNLGVAIKQIDATKLADAITLFCNDETRCRPTDGMQRYIQERHPNVFVEKLVSI